MLTTKNPLALARRILQFHSQNIYLVAQADDDRHVHTGIDIETATFV